MRSNSFRVFCRTEVDFRHSKTLVAVETDIYSAGIKAEKSGVMDVTVSGSEMLAFKAKVYANALGTIHYYGESTMLINESDVSVRITIPTALWHSVWTNYCPIYSDYVAIASSSDGMKLATTTYLYDYIRTSTDAGLTWTAQEASGRRDWMAIASSADGTKLVAVIAGSSSVYLSTDSG